MIQSYVNKLIENLPLELKTNQRIDLVLDGGIFNGSYLIGALYFLKEMERRKYITIERISGCSVGSIVAFLYFIDSLDIMSELYELAKHDFQNKFCLSILKKLKQHLKDRIPNNICEIVNGRLFICYNNIKTHKKIVKSTYKSSDAIIQSIIKSCYIPYLIDNKPLYKNKYVDGINAFIFNKQVGKKILHMELFGYDKIMYALNIKNEKTNFHRVLSGMLDIHSFYIKKSNTSMCSYIDDWNIINKSHYNVKLCIEFIFINVIYIMQYIKKFVSKDFDNNVFVQLITRISFDIFRTFINQYCL